MEADRYTAQANELVTDVARTVACSMFGDGVLLRHIELALRLDMAICHADDLHDEGKSARYLPLRDLLVVLMESYGVMYRARRSFDMNVLPADLARRMTLKHAVQKFAQQWPGEIHVKPES